MELDDRIAAWYPRTGPVMREVKGRAEVREENPEEQNLLALVKEQRGLQRRLTSGEHMTRSTRRKLKDALENVSACIRKARQATCIGAMR